MKKFNIKVNGTAYEVEVEEVKAAGAAAAPKAAPKAAPAVAAGAGETAVTAPMPGKVIAAKVSVGQAVNAGDVVIILEAMKMQNEIPATASGTVKAINANPGQAVKAGDALVIIG